MMLLKNKWPEGKYPDTMWCCTQITSGQNLCSFTNLICYFIFSIINLQKIMRKYYKIIFFLKKEDFRSFSEHLKHSLV